MTASDVASVAFAVAGDGPAARRREVLDRIDAIVDPCSRSLGRSVGLVAMGILERLDVAGDEVTVLLLPTFPTCLFRGFFEEEIRARVGTLPWCRDVAIEFCSADRLWDPSRMAAAAR